jgi:thymidylate synthase ThyX
MADDRISELSKRFRRHGVGRPPESTRTRERHSFYVDSDLITQLDQAYKDLNHKLYPKSVTKSQFLEAFIEHGLEHVSAIEAKLSETGES